MDHSGAAVTEASSPPRSAWTPLARSARRPEWHPLDPSHRRAVEGPPGSLSLAPDVSSPLSALGPGRNAPERPQGARRRPPRPWRPGSQRDVHRRLLCQRQKKGLHVGKTKRGKGTKIMAIADGAGLPLAITIASASPHETTLVGSTLNDSRLPATPERGGGAARSTRERLERRR